MRRPNYGAVTGVTTALVGVCVFRLLFQTAIPPPHPEVAQWGRGEFVSRGETQEVEWRPLGPAAFAEAQRLSRPIFIVVGVPWSALGRQADRAFATPEVARALNRGFIPIRVDGAQDPRWLSEFLPLERARTGFSVGFQAWVFDLKGRLIDFVGRLDSDDVLNQQAVVTALVRAQQRFAKAALEDETPELEASQQNDAAELLDPGISDLSLPNAARTLGNNLDPSWGGWDVRGMFVTRALAIRFLQLAGEGDLAGVALRHATLSPRADWLDGGYFRVVRRDTRAPEYDKTTVANAQFAETLAVQDAMHPDPLLREAAQRTISWLLSLRTDGMLPGAEQGDEDSRGRSARSSFPPQRLRQAVESGDLPPRVKEWAEANLGLDGSGGDARAVYVSKPSVVTDDLQRLDEALTSLRKAAGKPRVRVAAGLADVNAAAAACLLRIARLWGDPGLAAAGGDLVDQLEPLRAATLVRHSLTVPSSDGPYLCDSLAYADAALEDFLTNGRVPSLQHGTATLRAALATFAGSANGVLLPCPSTIPLIPGRSSLPQVTDDEREACSSMALRLLEAYSSVLGSDGADFHEAATALNARLGAVVEAVPNMGGALGALARHLDSRAAFVVGVNAQAQASALVRKLPNRLIVPVLGPARRDLRNRAPGIYLQTPGGITGPWSEAEVLKRLPTDLEVGL